MSRIIITRADEVLQTLQTRSDAQNPIRAVLSIEHPGAEAGVKGAAPRIADHGHGHVVQKILAFWDAEQIVHQGPDLEQVSEGLAFVMEQLAANDNGDVLIHCHAGKSRSVAMALGVLSLLKPHADEKELIDDLLAIRPIAAPNIIVVEMVDQLTGRNGKLLKAVEDHPVLTAQRTATEERRQNMLKNNPEMLKKLHPEKFFKP